MEDNKLRLMVGGTELAFRRPDDETYLRGLVDRFNEDLAEMQLAHTTATKLEVILMCALDYLDDKTKLEKLLAEKHGNG